MMNDGRVSTRYARALLASLSDGNASVEAYEQAQRMVPALQSIRVDFHQVLDSALVSFAEKERFVGVLFDRFAPALRSLATLMVRRGRGEYILRALLVFISLYRKRYGITYARVTTASPIDEGQVGALRAFLSDRMGMNVELFTSVDERLIGGFQLEVDDRLLDRSVRGELSQIAAQIV